ncbi:glycosyltransferase family A protein [Pseudodesulfovibrio sp. zrk46]|uniref:glycosyltransferase family 2 protein n=1 Tax=Pseudodesulfovibrio sp. zrk46 TaxID=2725288 RepID=UPI001449DD7A|nr:glycosyltransferase family A protein [Pseudodesulfovibrio sp. zrk46]QJB56495.1 glycosyltransferase family 2 protein [Pseudodesulfovibrio sp. zrk46]
MPRLSIVIPNYNYGRFADRFFGSIAAQTMQLDDVEILFVDDGSDDDSLLQAAKWQERIRCARFEILTPPRSGKPGLVRNFGLAQATGDLLQCLDPDDSIFPDYLAACVEAFGTDNHIGVVYTDYREHSSHGVRDVEVPKFTQGLLRTQNGLPPAAMIRRSLWDGGIRYRDNTEYEDWDFWIQCQMAGARFHHIQQVLYNYEIHGTNFSNHAVSRDGNAKAQIVLNNTCFFHPEVEKWARSYLRGRLHGQAMQRGYIPTPVDVKKLLRDVEKRVRELGPRS